jgi:hemerythrin
MPLVVWKPEMSVGVEALDTDHKMLVSLINQLAAAIEAGEAHEIVESVLNGLVDYTLYHFGREEAMLAACAYGDLAAHREAHAALAGRLNAVRDAYRRREPDIESRVLVFMRAWLTEHILGRDVGYAPSLAGQAQKLARVDEEFSERLAEAGETNPSPFHRDVA